ncbi:hypothetical protein L7F22_011244 [Adiantum nelumboides]|nr:hypothetical protein [Adiantum nelumboides]
MRRGLMWVVMRASYGQVKERWREFHEEPQVCMRWAAACVEGRQGVKAPEYELDKRKCLIKEPLLPGCFLRARAIGIMPMIDQGEKDDKIAVCEDDFEFRQCNDIKDLPPH